MKKKKVFKVYKMKCNIDAAIFLNKTFSVLECVLGVEVGNSFKQKYYCIKARWKHKRKKFVSLSSF